MDRHQLIRFLSLALVVIGVFAVFDPLGLGLAGDFLLQSAVALGAAILFAVELRRIGRYGERHPERAAETEWALVVVTGLVLIAMGNAVTAGATAVKADDARNFAGEMIRGVLVIEAVYLALAGPLARR